jgi:hypothetical protein
MVKKNYFFVLIYKQILISGKGVAALLFLFACLDSHLAQADTIPPLVVKADTVVPETIKLQDVVIEATRLYDNAVGSSNAASQGVVRSEDLHNLPLLRPGDALDTVPGMVVTQHSGDGKANQYFLRGYNLDHGTDFATYIDGVPVNMPTNAHGQGYADLNFLIPELVQRINYGKGPYFAGDGDFSSAGSAKFQYRDILDSNLASITVGSFGYQRALFAGSAPVSTEGSNSKSSDATTLSRATPRLLGAVDLMREDGPWVEPEGLHHFNGLLRLSDGTTANGWSVDGVYYDASWRSTDQVPLELIQSGQLGRYSSLDPSDGGNSKRAILSGEFHSENEYGYLKTSAFVQHYELQLWSNFTFFELRPTTGDQFEQVENRNIVGGQFVKGWVQSLLGHDSITEVGMQLRNDAIHVSLLNTQNRVPFGTFTDDFVNLTAISLYAQNDTTWNDWLRTIVGLREDGILMDRNARANPQNSGNASGNIVSPKLSLIFGPWYKTEYFFNAGKGFHSNDARGVIGKIDSTGMAVSPVPALVGSFGEEVGVRTEVISGLQSSLALWNLKSDSELVYTADSGGTSPNGASKVIGVEWDNHLIASSWLSLDANMAWTQARYAAMNDNGAAGDLIPNAVSKVGLFAATMHQGSWSGGIDTRYISEYPLTQDGSLMAPSATVTNLRIQRVFTREISMQIDILNFFNQQYYDIAYGQDYRINPTSPIVPAGITVHPGEPLQFRVTAKLAF